MDSPRRTVLAALLLLPLAGCSRLEPLPEETPPLPVRLARVERAAFQPTLALLGVMRSSGEAELVIPVAGRLSYPARFRAGLASGVPVQAGEVIARISNPEAAQELGEARLRLELAKSELTRYQRAFDSGVVPAAQLAQYQAAAALAAQRLDAARKREANLDLRSPMTGRLLVERRLPAAGEVQAGTVLARVSAGGAPKIEAQAAAADRERLHAGLAVRFVVPGRPETAGRGVIREISPVVGTGGTVAVLAEVVPGTEGGAGAALLPPPGEGVEVQVELDPRFRVLTVPEEALVVAAGEGDAAVYAAQGGIARRRQVTLGGRSGGRVEVLTGLSPGDRVVVGGAALLSDGARVTPLEEPAAVATEAGGTGGGQ
jgi:multidrug efflux system membrane fusion protein